MGSGPITITNARPDHAQALPPAPLGRASLRSGTLDGRYVSSVSETQLDTHVYPVYPKVTSLILMVCVSSVFDMTPDTQCI